MTPRPSCRPVPAPRLVALAAGLLLGLGACGADEPADDTAAPDPTGEATAAPAPTSETEAAPPSDQPFGPGCGELFPAEGEGSIAGVADDPVATALANVPAFSQVAAAVQAAALAEPLNSQQDVTVLVPADQAFAAVPADQREALLADVPRLTQVLTQHVVQGRLVPAALAGTHPTLNNDQLTVEGSGAQYAVPAEGTLVGEQPAQVLCGNVPTANATVYVVDQILAPPAG